MAGQHGSGMAHVSTGASRHDRHEANAARFPQQREQLAAEALALRLGARTHARRPTRRLPGVVARRAAVLAVAVEATLRHRYASRQQRA